MPVFDDYFDDIFIIRCFGKRGVTIYMLCFPCYIFSFKLLLNQLELNFYYVVEVEALVPSMDSKR